MTKKSAGLLGIRVTVTIWFLKTGFQNPGTENRKTVQAPLSKGRYILLS